jgi:hypothetical protein
MTMTFLRILMMLAALLAWPGRLWAQTSQLSGTGSVEYRLVHKFHTITGVSKALVVKGTVDASGLKLMARAPVATFDSNNSNRDAHMMEAVEGEKFPWVNVRAVLPGFKLPTSGTTKITVQASVDLHGVSVNHPIDITLETKDGATIVASFTFSESLTAHKIERPSLLFVAVDDLITISGKADVAVRSGGVAAHP